MQSELRTVPYTVAEVVPLMITPESDDVTCCKWERFGKLWFTMAHVQFLAGVKPATRRRGRYSVLLLLFATTFWSCRCMMPRFSDSFIYTWSVLFAWRYHLQVCHLSGFGLQSSEKERHLKFCYQRGVLRVVASDVGVVRARNVHILYLIQGHRKRWTGFETAIT